MKNSRLSKFVLVITFITLFVVLTSTASAATKQPHKNCHTENVAGGHVTYCLTLTDTNGDGCYDRWDLWVGWDLPILGDGEWRDGGDFKFRSPGGGYFNDNPLLDPAGTDYIGSVTVTPAGAYTNPDGYRIEYRDTTTQELTGVFEKIPGEPMPLYTSYKVGPYKVGDVDTTTSVDDTNPIVLTLDVDGFTKIYPNPANEQIKIHFGLDPDVGVQWQDFFNSLKFDYLKIYNIEGKVVYERKDFATQNEITIDTKSWVVGTYSVEISIAGIKGSTIFVISR